jgi:predicted nucleic-acid-binding Zn-ribbon protein
MSEEIECPYCKQINYVEEEGLSYGDEVESHVDCDHCRKDFVAICQARFDFYPWCADGLHEFKDAIPLINCNDFSHYRDCKNCQHTIFIEK